MAYRILFDSGHSVVVDADDAPDLSGSDSAWVLVESPKAKVLFPVRRVVAIIDDRRDRIRRRSEEAPSTEDQHVRSLTLDVGTLSVRLARHHGTLNADDCRVCSGLDSPPEAHPIGYVRSNGAGEIVFRQAGHPGNDAQLGPEWKAVWT
jgi:hypothetical protein